MSERKQQRISATDLARGLSDVLNRVRYGNESFVVERGGRPVCEVRPSGYGSTFTGADLVDLLASVPSPGTEYLELVERNLERQPPAEKTSWNR